MSVIGFRVPGPEPHPAPHREISGWHLCHNLRRNCASAGTIRREEALTHEEIRCILRTTMSCCGKDCGVCSKTNPTWKSWPRRAMPRRRCKSVRASAGNRHRQLGFVRVCRRSGRVADPAGIPHSKVLFLPRTKATRGNAARGRPVARCGKPRRKNWWRW